jgi:gas vesicle protein
MNTGKSFLCFMAGAMAGAVAALLLAPGSGENTRAKIKQGAAGIAGKAKSRIAEGLEIIENALEEE